MSNASRQANPADDASGPEYTVTFYNGLPPAFDLPKTGGSGSLLFLLCGGTLAQRYTAVSFVRRNAGCGGICIYPGKAGTALRKIIAGILLAAGLCLMLAPWGMDQIHRKIRRGEIEKYADTVQERSDRKLNEEWNRACEYNRIEKIPADLTEPGWEQKYEELLNHRSLSAAPERTAC